MCCWINILTLVFQTIDQYQAETLDQYQGAKSNVKKHVFTCYEKHACCLHKKTQFLPCCQNLRLLYTLRFCKVESHNIYYNLGLLVFICSSHSITRLRICFTFNLISKSFSCLFKPFRGLLLKPNITFWFAHLAHTPAKDFRRPLGASAKSVLSADWLVTQGGLLSAPRLSASLAFEQGTSAAPLLQHFTKAPQT